MQLIELRSQGLYPPRNSVDTSAPRLALAILRQALFDLTLARSADRKARKHFEEALDWFLETSAAPGSFEWVCDALEFSSNRIRSFVERYASNVDPGGNARFETLLRHTRILRQKRKRRPRRKSTVRPN